jgi:putative CocE/NonD family hydrolase
MGAEVWKYADELDSISNKILLLYLNSNGSANDVFQSGHLQEVAPTTSPPDSYTYDPLDTRPAEMEREWVENYLTDQRYALNLFGNGLVYHSRQIQEDTEISGFVKLVVWMALDVPDTDFEVTLSEVQLDGAHIILTQDRLRARYCQSLIEERLVEPGEINRYEFEGFTFFSRLVSKGSRLRLLIQCPNTIYLQKNYNSGGVVAQETAEDARTAQITLYHDAKHPSYL